MSNVKSYIFLLLIEPLDTKAVMSGEPPLPMLPQPQPFRFWLPYRSNVALSRPRPRPRPMPSSPRTQPRCPQPPSTNAPQTASSQPPPPHSAPPPQSASEKAEVARWTSQPPSLLRSLKPPPQSASQNAEPEPVCTVEQEVPIQSDTNHDKQDATDESNKIPIQTLDSLQRSATPKLDLELKISRPPSTDQERSSNGANGSKETKIAISGFPRARLFEGGRAQYRREIEDGIKSLAGHEKPPPRPGCDQAYRVITLAGHNIGASMVLGSKDASRNGETSDPKSGATPAVEANVNSNVQSINNSAMEASSCNVGDPGVHMDVKNEHEEPVVVMERKEKPKEPIRRPPLDLAQDKRATPEPRVRRRCLRALMMESESDPENPQKPRRHGCRFTCEEKKGKDIEDHAPATTSNGVV